MSTTTTTPWRAKTGIHEPNPITHRSYPFHATPDILKHLTAKSTRANVHYTPENDTTSKALEIVVEAILERATGEEDGTWNANVTMVPNRGGHPDDVATLWLTKGEFGKVLGRVELGRVY